VGPEDKLQYRPVELGRNIEGLRVIRRGLNRGEQIVVSGLQRVRPGMQIKPVAGQMTAAARGS
jgi:multidrug efflux pump subunit AcrA (membrane-fusion protein)